MGYRHRRGAPHRAARRRCRGYRRRSGAGDTGGGHRHREGRTGTGGGIGRGSRYRRERENGREGRGRRCGVGNAGSGSGGAGRRDWKEGLAAGVDRRWWQRWDRHCGTARMEPGGGVRGAGGGGGSRRTGGEGRTDARGDTAAHSDTRSAPAPTGTEPAPPSLGGHCGAAPTPTFALSAVPSVRAGGAAGQSPLCLWSVIRHGRVPAAMSSLRLMTELGPRLAPRGDSPAGSCVPLNGSECSGRARTLRRLQLPSEAAALLRVPTAGSEQGAAVWLCVLAAGCRDAPGIRAWGCIRALCCCSAWGLCVAPSTAMGMAWVPSVPAPAHGSAVAQGEPTGGVLHVPIPQHLPPRREQPAGECCTAASTRTSSGTMAAGTTVNGAFCPVAAMGAPPSLVCIQEKLFCFLLPAGSAGCSTTIRDAMPPPRAACRAQGLTWPQGHRLL